MNTDTLRQIASRTADRLDTDSVAELLGGLFLSLLSLWAGNAVTYQAASYLPWDDLATTTNLSKSLFVGFIAAAVTFPALALLLIAVYNRWSVKGYDITPIIAVPYVAIVLDVAAVLQTGAPLSTEMSIEASTALAEIMLLGVFIWLTGLGTLLAILAFRQSVEAVGRQHVAVTAVALLCVLLIAGGSGAMAVSLSDQNDNDIGADDDETTFIYEKHDNLSKWDSGFYGLTGADVTVRENTTSAAAYTCDDQPSPVTLDAVAGQPAAETTAAPERLHLTLYEDADGAPIHAQFEAEFNVSGEHVADHYSQGPSIVPSYTAEGYWYTDRPVWMANVESMIVVSDYVTEDGEVHRYGARLCRPDVE